MGNITSLWQKDRIIPSFPELSGEIQADVLVIGGGMAGLLTAYRLQQKGIDTVLVDMDRICSGTTAGTTAKITAQHGFLYHKILREYDESFAKMYYKANSQAVKSIKQLCRDGNCALEIKDNFVYSYDSRKLDRELSALQKIDISVKYEEILPLPIVPSGAIGFQNQGQFHPMELGRYLSEKLKIYEKTKVIELIGTTAVTDRGKIKAEKIVIATHFPFINKHGSYFLKLYQHRSYMLALEQVQPLDAMYVDENRKGLSFSTFGNTLLLGGGSHRTGKQGGSYGELRCFQKQHYPHAAEQFCWAAQDTMSLDGIPYIGHYSANTPNLYVAAGFNKWGMTGAMVSAEIISGMIAGEQPDYAPVFSPSRSMVKPQLLVNCFEATKHMLIPTTRRCPHLGCALKYNKQEHSWDCACHGSRFSESGKLLNNPANGDLK